MDACGLISRGWQIRIFQAVISTLLVIVSVVVRLYLDDSPTLTQSCTPYLHIMTTDLQQVYFSTDKATKITYNLPGFEL